MTRTSLQAYQYKRLTNIRRWQIHPGANHFCFDGHCIAGRDLSGAIITISLISLTSILWFVFEYPVLIKEFPLLVLLIGLVLICYTLIYFFRSMCTDPGIISRPSSLERSISKKFSHLNRLTSAQLNDFIIDIQVNKIIVQCKYCVTCQMIRPPRSSHCAICSNCVSCLDHHCPFLSTCVGMRNYRFFIFFLFFLLQTQLFFFATSLIKILNSTNDLSSIPSYFILIITGPSAIYTCNLLGYHCMISSRALTTREDDKGIYLKGNNPFDAQLWYLNLARRFCTSLPPNACE